MLDTIPIVKVGARDEADKTADVELADTANGAAPAQERATEDSEGTETREAAVAIPGAVTTTRTTGDETAEPEPRRSSIGGIAAATTAQPNASSEAIPESEEQGCSICTEDFEVGQDQRVLPCNHKFHPACIDPWLLNVSGTCPLCRIDLRPPEASASADGEVDTEGNPIRREGEEGAAAAGEVPPLLADVQAEESRRRSVRRSIIAGLTGTLIGSGSPRSMADTMTREERVMALREYRVQLAARAERRRREEAERGTTTSGPEGVAQRQEEERGLRTRLRNAFRVRTRRTGQTEPAVAGEPAAQVGAAESAPDCAPGSDDEPDAAGGAAQDARREGTSDDVAGR